MQQCGLSDAANRQRHFAKGVGMRKYALLLVLNVIIWGIVALELAYIRPCSANQPQLRLHGPTLSAAQNQTICL